MNFKLKIVSPDGTFYDAEAYSLSLRAIDGELAIYHGHIPFLTAVAIGECRVYPEQGAAPLRAACCGGILNVAQDALLLAPTTFEWADDIDIARAENALERANSRLASDTLTDAEKRIYALKKDRATLRLKVAKNSAGKLSK